jgi:hypothetical protein
MARSTVRWSGATAQLRRALLGDSMLGDDNKRHRKVPHLLAQHRDDFSTAERQRRRRTAAAAS